MDVSFLVRKKERASFNGALPDLRCRRRMVLRVAKSSSSASPISDIIK